MVVWFRAGPGASARLGFNPLRPYIPIKPLVPNNPSPQQDGPAGLQTVTLPAAAQPLQTLALWNQQARSHLVVSLAQGVPLSPLSPHAACIRTSPP